MTSMVSSKSKEKQAKGKNSIKKRRPNRKKKQNKTKGTTRKQKTVSPGVEPDLSARASNSLTTAPQ